MFNNCVAFVLDELKYKIQYIDYHFVLFNKYLKWVLVDFHDD